MQVYLSENTQQDVVNTSVPYQDINVPVHYQDKFISVSKNCPVCYEPTSSFGWCMACEINSMKEKFPYWSSGNKDIDGLIRHTQLNAKQTCDYLECIPFEAFDMVKYIGRGGFSSIYSALWMEGPRLIWDDELQEWTRTGPIKVALKRLDNSINIKSSYVDQVVMIKSNLISFLPNFELFF